MRPLLPPSIKDAVGVGVGDDVVVVAVDGFCFVPDVDGDVDKRGGACTTSGLEEKLDRGIVIGAGRRIEPDLEALEIVDDVEGTARCPFLREFPLLPPLPRLSPPPFFPSAFAFAAEPNESDELFCFSFWSNSSGNDANNDSCVNSICIAGDCEGIRFNCDDGDCSYSSVRVCVCWNSAEVGVVTGVLLEAHVVADTGSCGNGGEGNGCCLSGFSVDNVGNTIGTSASSFIFIFIFAEVVILSAMGVCIKDTVVPFSSMLMTSAGNDDGGVERCRSPQIVPPPAPAATDPFPENLLLRRRFLFPPNNCNDNIPTFLRPLVRRWS